MTRPQSSRILATPAAALLAAALLGSPGDPVAVASEPGSLPVFSAATEITNPLHPVTPGTVRVYRGATRGVPVVALETDLAGVREFEWQGVRVTCRMVEAIEFERGVEASRTLTFVAQADDGSVWTFGEVEMDDSDTGPDDDPPEPKGWIVGARAPEDPALVVEAAGPALLLPAAPRTGDQWRSADVAPEFLDERRVERTDLELRVAGVSRSGCARIEERDLVDATRESRWYAPGVGLVRARSPGDTLVLVATTARGRR